MTNAHEGKKSKGTAVITGASAGIGRAYAENLAKRGFDLLLVARRKVLLVEITSSLIKTYGIKANYIVADLGKAQGVSEVADRISSDATITMLVNNAGTATMSPIGNTALADAEAMTDLNITAVLRLTLAVLPGFRARDHGTIINIGSVLGFHWLPISPIYSATKAYVLYFTRGLQEELSGTGVSVQLVSPAATSTDLWEISGVPLSALDPNTVMTVSDLVEAALAGLDQGEKVTLPSIEDAERLLGEYDSARTSLLMAAQTGKPASRYR